MIHAFSSPLYQDINIHFTREQVDEWGDPLKEVNLDVKDIGHLVLKQRIDDNSGCTVRLVSVIDESGVEHEYAGKFVPNTSESEPSILKKLDMLRGAFCYCIDDQEAPSGQCLLQDVLPGVTADHVITSLDLSDTENIVLVKKMLKITFQALEELNKNKVQHGDCQARNVMWDLEKKTATFFDFGISAETEESSLNLMDLEMLNSSFIDKLDEATTETNAEQVAKLRSLLERVQRCATSAEIIAQFE